MKHRPAVRRGLGLGFGSGSVSALSGWERHCLGCLGQRPCTIAKILLQDERADARGCHRILSPTAA